MADNIKYVAIKIAELQTGTAIGATSATLSRIEDRDGNTLTMTDFGSKGFGVAEPGETNEESFVFTGISSTTISGISNVLTKAPYTESSGFNKDHSAGVKIVLYTNSPALYNTLLNKDNDETITGLYTFTNTNIPRLDSYIAPTADEEFAPKKYVDDTTAAGAADATFTVKGLVEIATAAEVAAGSTVGGSGAQVVIRPNEIADHIQSGAYLFFTEDGTGSDDTYTATLTPTLASYTEGQIFVGKITVANTGAATLNLDGNGAAPIKKYISGAIADIETGDIVANQHCIFVYDGTNFVMMNPSATTMDTPAQVELEALIEATDITGAELESLSDASTITGLHHHDYAFGSVAGNGDASQVIAHGLGVTPKRIKITACVSTYAPTGAGDFAPMSIGMYDGTNTHTVVLNRSNVSPAGEVDTTNICRVVDDAFTGENTATAAIDATNITLTWSATDHADVAILWEAWV